MGVFSTLIVTMSGSQSEEACPTDAYLEHFSSQRQEVCESAKNTSSWRASIHHGVQQGRQCAGQLTIDRHAAYLEYTQNIGLQRQGKSIKWVNPTTLICSNVSPETPKRLISCRLTGAGSLLPPICCEAWAKGNIKVSPWHPFLTGCHLQQTCS
ncbi:hypothetical protein TNCV_4851811 [Trichonephila clavipes]|nr:hypothetical protein TNCV_4851811 [Trichonephila clavipes]